VRSLAKAFGKLGKIEINFIWLLNIDFGMPNGHVA